MKKTITINLAGMVFTIDNDAYRLLDDYLTKVEKHFKNEKDKEEILNDIEARIAELLNEKITGDRQVVLIKDVEEIIAIMGNPSDFGEAEEEKTYQATFQRKKHRRFYRDTDNRILGGVSSGLAAYWGMDPTIIRIAFIVITVMGFAGVIIYLILWIIMPEAKTVAQKLEMRGEPVNVSNIGNFFREEFENVKRSFRRRNYSF
jgi:phage shock protein PspC (stress-responsive transcriptional regulator)